MERLRLTPRANWQARAEDVGFTWHHDNGQPYWDESAAYAFTLAEVEEGVEAPTAELHQMCLDLVDEATRSEELMALLDIPGPARDYVADSWRRGEPSLYGRFDFAFDGRGPAKLYEYNADTPTSVFETAVFQWLWLEDRLADGTLPPDADQFNSLHERLIDRFRQMFPRGELVHFASDPEFVEDRRTVLYLEDLAKQAGLDPQFTAVSDIGVNAEGRLVDREGWLIRALFKLYPWEEMMRDRDAPALASSGARILEPAWKSLLSNKGILPLLWVRHPGHPNLLEAYFESDPAAAALSGRFVRKPLFSREGANISIHEGAAAEHGEDGGYGSGRAVLQAVHAPPAFHERHVIVGSWVVGDQPAGMGLREDAGRITRNTSCFVPHFIRG